MLFWPFSGAMDCGGQKGPGAEAGGRIRGVRELSARWEVSTADLRGSVHALAGVIGPVATRTGNPLRRSGAAE